MVQRIVNWRVQKSPGKCRKREAVYTKGDWPTENGSNDALVPYARFLGDGECTSVTFIAVNERGQGFSTLAVGGFGAVLAQIVVL